MHQSLITVAGYNEKLSTLNNLFHEIYVQTFRFFFYLILIVTISAS